MADLDDLFPGTIEIPKPNASASDGGHFYRHGLGSLGSLEHYNGSTRRLFLNIYDSDEEFSVDVYEVVTGLSAKPGVRIKSPRKRLLTRDVGASVPPIGDYDSIADAIRGVATKLRANYFARYKEPANIALEEVIAACLLQGGVQPPYEA